MLISCYQCRQPMDVPDDCAGRRVRCPHCQHVLVVPGNKKSEAPEGSVQADGPLLALPNLDLDTDDRPAEAKVPVQSVPPTEAKPLPYDDLPPPPPITRRRRTPALSQPKPGGSWNRLIVLGAVLGVLVIVFGVVMSGDLFRARHAPPPQVAFRPPPKPMDIPKAEPFFHLKQLPPGVAIIPAPDPLVWHEFAKPDRRFKVLLPSAAPESKQNFPLMMTAFEARQGDWEFAVAHRSMKESEFNTLLPAERFRTFQQALLRERPGMFVLFAELTIHINAIHQGKEWVFQLPNGKHQFVRTYFVREEDQYHHYLLTAQGPFNTKRADECVNRFFNSFAVSVSEGGNAHVGEVVHEVFDDIHLPTTRRDDEFTALALHPKQPLAVVGTVSSRVSIVPIEPPQGKRAAPPTFVVKAGKAIEQLAISPDGRWLALSVNGEIQIRGEWTGVMPVAIRAVPGLRCAFTAEQQLLVASSKDVKLYDPETAMPGDTLEVPDFNIKGLALAPDEMTLAVWSDKTIALWNWPDRKELGRIDAHVGPISGVIFSPDGKTLASAGADRTIKLWQVKSRKERAMFKQHAWTVASLAFAPGGERLVSAGLDGMVLVWDLEREPSLIWAQAHQFPVRNVAFSATGEHCFLTCKHPSRNDALSGRHVRQVRKIAWDAVQPNEKEAARMLAQRAGLHLPTAGSTFFASAGRSIVTASDPQPIAAKNQRLRLWDADSGRMKSSFPAMPGGNLSPDGKWFVFARPPAQPGQLIALEVLDVESNRVLPGSFQLAVGFVLGQPILFTPDSKSFWVMHDGKFVRVEFQAGFARREEIKLREPNEAPNARLVNIYPSADHKTFLVDTSSFTRLRTRKLYSAVNGAELPLPKLGANDWSSFVRLRFSPERFLEVEDILQAKSQAIGQQRIATFLTAFSPDQTLCVTAEAGGPTLQLNLWDTKERRPLLTLPDFNARASTQIRVAPDGRHLAWTTNAGWTRIVPVDWLMERKELLPCNPKEVAAP